MQQLMAWLTAFPQVIVDHTCNNISKQIATVTLYTHLGNINPLSITLFCLIKLIRYTDKHTDRHTHLDQGIERTLGSFQLMILRTLSALLVWPPCWITWLCYHGEVEYPCCCPLLHSKSIPQSILRISNGNLS